MRARRATAVTVAVLLVTALVAVLSSPVAGAKPPDHRYVEVVTWAPTAECRADAVAHTALGSVYVVTGAWYQDASPVSSATVTCLVNGAAVTAPLPFLGSLLSFLPIAGRSVLAPGIAVGTTVVRGDQLTLCAQISWSADGSTFTDSTCTS